MAPPPPPKHDPKHPPGPGGHQEPHHGPANPPKPAPHQGKLKSCQTVLVRIMNKRQFISYRSAKALSFQSEVRSIYPLYLPLFTYN